MLYEKQQPGFVQALQALEQRHGQASRRRPCCGCGSLARDPYLENTPLLMPPEALKRCCLVSGCMPRLTNHTPATRLQLARTRWLFLMLWMAKLGTGVVPGKDMLNAAKRLRVTQDVEIELDR
jgi:hypothetical protein